MKEDKKYHIGHRKRLRNRYIENGIDALAEHEILELVLFYSVHTEPVFFSSHDKQPKIRWSI